MIHRILILWIVLLFVNTLEAQEPFYYRIDKSKGLPSNTVYDIFQDSRGFVWVSSGQGLSRYDGRRFVTYSSDKQTLKSGSNIQEDKYGRVWYANFDGYIYYVENDSLNYFHQSPVWGYLRFGIVGNSLFCVEPGYITQYNLGTLKAIKRYKFSTSQILVTHFDNTHFYVLSNSFLYTFSENKNYSAVKTPDFFASYFKVPLMVSYKNKLVIAAKKPAFYTLFSDGKFSYPQTIPGDVFLQNISASSDDCWFCTTKGVFSSALSQRSTAYNHYYDDFNITTTLRDKSGATWIGTMGNGILYIPDFRTRFYPSDAEINVLSEFGHEVLTGTVDKVSKLNTTDFSTRELFDGKDAHESYLLSTNMEAERIFMTSNKFKVMDLNGKILDEIEIAMKDICRISDKYYAFAASGIMGLMAINNATDSMDKRLNGVEKRPFKAIDLYVLRNNVRAKSIAWLPQTTTVFFATNTGLFYWSANGLKELKDVRHEQVFLNQLVSWKNSIWGVSSAGKVYKVGKEMHIQKMDFSSQLSGNQIRRLKILNNQMYVFAGNSLYHLDFADMKLDKVISLHYDLNLNDALMYNNQFILATTKGIVVLNKAFRSTRSTPGLVINNFRAGDKNQFFTENEPTNLKSNQNNLTIDYSILSFDPNDTPELHYSINNGKWEQIRDDRHTLELRNMPPGNYTLRMRSSNGAEFSSVRVLKFHIQHPFWMQWWFLSIITVLILILLYKYDQWRTKRINRKSQEIINRIELEKAANQSKLKALKSQMNPHFFFNALNTIQSFILENDKKQAINYLSKFSGLTRSILEMSEKDEITIAEEIKVLGLYLDIEKARFNGDFEYEITTTNVDEDVLKIPSLLLQPYVENAVKHGLLHKQGLKKLHLHFETDNTILTIILKDNGVGRKISMELNAIKNKRHKSFATKATEQRMSLLNEYSGKKITLGYIDETNESGQVTGTTVVIKIPLVENEDDKQNILK